MAEEQKNPEEENTVEETVEEVEATVEETSDAVEDVVEDVADKAEEIAEDVATTIDEQAIVAQTSAEMAAESVAETAEDAVETVEDAVETAIEAVETDTEAEAQLTAIETAEAVVEADGHGGHHYSDDVVLPYFGHVGTMPGGIYTFVFIVLGVLTAIEVGLTLIGENAFIITILVVLSLMKAVLVMMYYMHLKDDNPLYRLVVILPLLIVLLSTLYLLFVPTGAGLGYS